MASVHTQHYTDCDSQECDLRGHTYGFIELFAPHLTREVVAKAMHVSASAE